MNNQIIDLKEHKGKAEILWAVLTEINGNEQVVLCQTIHGRQAIISLNLEMVEEALSIVQPEFKKQGLSAYIGKFKRDKNYD